MVEIETQNQIDKIEGICDEAKVKEDIVFSELHKEAEAKSIERKIRKHELKSIQ